ncbi:nitroreductase [Saccharothrix tamanrassetensis]|uniref:Putative NAD(P)H nitroreductase n=1 Tax=Saccharothrix tamanrassetensis TaxID=1051531 RepID=A0A841C8X7_9PSEU|nr:nitroreductase [Saccharothrix tamanrassetensis]MBB5953869.1 nitroreductase [Saccharothrix tamanrassetensis]
MSTLDVIAARRSAARLVGPGPDPVQLGRMLEAAAQAPDHGRCRPWSFTLIPAESAAAFGDVLASAYARRCRETGEPVDPERLAKERAKASRAPVCLVVACRPRLDGRIPVHEQFAAVAAATQNLLLAATACGFGSKWVTGAAATDPAVKRALGLGEHDGVVGFVYLGTVPESARQRPRPSGEASPSVRVWTYAESHPAEPASTDTGGDR